MDRSGLRSTLTNLFQATGEAHHVAFAATDGADPDWPIWYADYLQEPLASQAQIKLHKSNLIYCLMNADFERTARAPDSKWPEFYADEFINRVAPSEAPAKDKLALYYLATCPFSIRVLSAIDRLGVDVELREIRQHPEFREELVGVRGRPTVPVLRITAPDGEERWMPESTDIIRYLEQSYGEPGSSKH
jgi:glutaredoxin